MDIYKKENGKLKLAPRVLAEEDGRIITAPTAADYARHGMYPFSAVPPDSRDGYSAVVSGYEVSDGHWVPMWSYEPIPAMPVTYSKLKLYAALAKAGLWDALRAWLETQTVNGLNAYTAFSLAQDLTSDNALFAEFRDAAKTALGVDEETVAAILAASEADA